MASAHPPPSPTAILTRIRTNIDSNIAASVDRNSREYLGASLGAFKDAIDELDVWMLQIHSKIVRIETQLPTVVHEYDGERRARLEGRLRALEGERDDLRGVRVRVVEEHEDVWRRWRELGLRRLGEEGKISWGYEDLALDDIEIPRVQQRRRGA